MIVRSEATLLYLIHPDRTMAWVDYFGQDPIDEAVANGRDLGLLENWWDPAESVAEDIVVRVALRHGTASAKGIIIPGIHVAQVRRPAELAQLAAESERVRREAAPHFKVVDEFIEAQAPGWIAHGEELDKRVQASMNATREEARREAQEELDAPVKPDLVAHWARLGGPLPTNL
ncbi:hypothetical protein [Agromyces bauzanensis]